MKHYSFIISCFSFYTKLKTKQTRIENVLESKGIQFELIDISAGDDDTKAAVREEMRKGPGPTAMPPQLYNGTEYCGVSKEPGTGPCFNGFSLSDLLQYSVLFTVESLSSLLFSCYILF